VGIIKIALYRREKEEDSRELPVGEVVDAAILALPVPLARARLRLIGIIC
jgi:CRISPR/Cas system CMR subunit Cmr4 (Cas7 group RAMP superfamily)